MPENLPTSYIARLPQPENPEVKFGENFLAFLDNAPAEYVKHIADMVEGYMKGSGRK